MPGRSGSDDYLALFLHDILLIDVRVSVEANTEVVNCQEPVCPLNKKCELNDIFDEAQDVFLTRLEKYTLADIGQQRNKIIRLLMLA